MSAAETSPGPRVGALEYAGRGEPDVLIATDLPHDGPLGWVAEQLAAAVRLVLEERGWRAGSCRVGYRACDDADGRGGVYDERLARANARALAADPKLVAWIGSFNSGATEAALPVLARAHVA